MDREKVRKTKETLDKTIGDNIRIERSLRNLSREELAEILELTTSHMGLIERGERGATNVTLMKLSCALSKPIDDFFYASKKSFAMREKDNKNKLEANRKKISSLTAFLAESELEFIISVIRGVVRLNPSYDAAEYDYIYEDEDGSEDSTL